MAAVQCRHGSYRVVFRFEGKQHSFTLGEVSSAEAQTKAAQVDYLLMRLQQRLAIVPPGTGIVDYVRLDGNPPAEYHEPALPSTWRRMASPTNHSAALTTSRSWAPSRLHRESGFVGDR